jgi:hypothetical protein
MRNATKGTSTMTAGTTDVIQALPLKLEECLNAYREPYLSDAEDTLEVRTCLQLVEHVLKKCKLRQQNIVGGIPTEVTYHENYEALGPVYGQLYPIMEGCMGAIAGLSDPDTDEIHLAFVLETVTQYLDGLDTTVRETY